MRGSELANRLGMAAHRCTRVNADVTLLCEYAQEAARVMGEKADAIESHDVLYVRGTLERLAWESQGGQKELAGALGVSLGYLNDVINERREPGAKLLDAMGLERVVTYRNKAMP